MTTAEKFKQGWSLMMEACSEGGWGDPFSYARSREILMAVELGHSISETLSGADGIDEDGECEYKSTIGKSIKAKYSGISIQPTWELQLSYLKNKKIGKYPNHYIARFDSSGIAECWKMTSNSVLECLLPKLEKNYYTVGKTKDPRLYADLSMSEIKKHGIRVI